MPAVLSIPEETKKKFPELVDGVQKSRSMNDEERQYWIDVLPIMTDEQIKNLREILKAEQSQIAEADNRYKQDVDAATGKAKAAFDEAVYMAKKRAREEAERAQEKEEKTHEEALLEELKQF